MIPYEVILALPPQIEVTLVTFQGVVEVPSAIRERCRDVIVLNPTASAVREWWGLIGGVYPVDTRLTGGAVLAQVRDLMAQHEATLVHGPHLGGLVRALSAGAGPVAYQTVDPWSIRTSMEAELTTGPRSWFRRYSARRRDRLERAIPPHVRLLTVGQADAQAWHRRLGREVVAVPNGITVSGADLPDSGTPLDPPVPGDYLCFTGSLDYGPNVESATRLVRQVAPVIWEHRPDLHVVIAGRSPLPEVRALAGDRVRVLANVPDLLGLVRGAAVAVFPDLHGLGKRNSVSEALALGTPVVATEVGAREQGSHPLLTRAERDDEIARAALEALTRGASQDTVAMRTWEDAAADYLARLS